MFSRLTPSFFEQITKRKLVISGHIDHIAVKKAGVGMMNDGINKYLEELIPQRNELLS